MPIVFAHSARLRLRTATYFGVIDDHTLVRAYRDMAGDFDESLDNIVDLTGVTTLLITEAAVDELATLFAANGNERRLAIIAYSSVSEGITPLLRRLHSAADVHVCGSLAAAQQWLRTHEI